MALFAVLCVLLSPVAGALIAMLMAWRERRIGVYTIVGVICCASLLLPWVYLFARLGNKRPPNFITWASYVVIYALWIYGPIYAAYILFKSSALHSLQEAVQLGVYQVTMHPLHFLLLGLTVSTMIGSLYLLFSERHRPTTASQHNEFIPQLHHVAPFTLAAFWAITNISAFYYTVAPNEPGTGTFDWIFWLWGGA